MIDHNLFMQAKTAHRQAVEMMYEGTCTVYEKQGSTDPKTKITSQREVPVYEEVACKLSFSKIMPVEKQAEGYRQVQTVKLFLAPEINVKPGSKIVVTQNNVTEAYKMSSLAAVYASHQEIMLDAWDGWT